MVRQAEFEDLNVMPKSEKEFFLIYSSHTLDGNGRGSLRLIEWE